MKNNKTSTCDNRIANIVSKENAYKQIYELTIAFINRGKVSDPVFSAIKAFKGIH